MINLYGLTLSKLEQLMLEEGQKSYRATQLFTWIYEKRATSFDEMSDISIKFREVLKEKYCLDVPSIHTKQVSQDGTVKLLLNLKDNYKVECVLMRYSYGCAVCVSSQVGCNMACSFCSSGILGKHGVSIASLYQNDTNNNKDKKVSVIITTHRTKSENLSNALEEIDKLSIIKAKTIKYRIEI